MSGEQHELLILMAKEASGGLLPYEKELRRSLQRRLRRDPLTKLASSP